MALAIQVKNLCKAYQLGEIGTGTLSRDLERWFAKIRGKEDPFLMIGETNDRATKATSDVVWSLKDVNLEISKGEAIGIIGRNGAGKSTLLKLLSRVTSPTSGSFKVKGRIASLLEVGTGFHPDLTGRENIFLNGAILGMRKKEISRRFDEIVDFAGVERYVDTPVKRYSSGMYVRLAFAVAAHLESEILIVDEVLAVGDAEFQDKCLGKLGDVSKSEGRTVLFVSHNMNAISSLCKSCILLSKGQVEFTGSTESVIKSYLYRDVKNRTIAWINSMNEYYNPHCTLQKFQLVNQSLRLIESGIVSNDKHIIVKLDFTIKELHTALCLGIAVFNRNNDLMFWSYHTDNPRESWITLKTGENFVLVEIPKNMLNEGLYIIRPLISLHLSNG
jgi:lipopolysaccharide transport system ATP-binding protein